MTAFIFVATDGLFESEISRDIRILQERCISCMFEVTEISAFQLSQRCSGVDLSGNLRLVLGLGLVLGLWSGLTMHSSHTEIT